MRKYKLIFLPIALFLLVIFIYNYKLVHDYLRNIYGIISEDWSGIPSIVGYGNSEWIIKLNDTNGFILHALGGKGTRMQNSVESARNSLKSGMKFLEVDLSLNQDGDVICHHPESSINYDKSEAFKGAEVCSVDTLLELAEEFNAYIIPDIKNSFYKISNNIIDIATKRNNEKRIIFQLYHPNHIKWYYEKVKFNSLSTPIISTYQSRVTITRILKALEGKVLVVAIPVNDQPVIPKYYSLLNILSYPIATCKELLNAKNNGSIGYYVPLRVALTCNSK